MFKIGQRVRPSLAGIGANIFHGTYRGQKKAEWSGVVTNVDNFNTLTVRWDGLKGTMRYPSWFIEPDKRVVKVSPKAEKDDG